MNTLSPHTPIDYAGKWRARHSRNASSETRSLFDSSTVPEEEEEEDDDFEYIAPVLKESPTEILARIASRKSSLQNLPATNRKDTQPASSPVTLTARPGGLVELVDVDIPRFPTEKEHTFEDDQAGGRRLRMKLDPEVTGPLAPRRMLHDSRVNIPPPEPFRNLQAEKAASTRPRLSLSSPVIVHIEEPDTPKSSPALITPTTTDSRGRESPTHSRGESSPKSASGRPQVLPQTSTTNLPTEAPLQPRVKISKATKPATTIIATEPINEVTKRRQIILEYPDGRIEKLNLQRSKPSTVSKSPSVPRPTSRRSTPAPQTDEPESLRAPRALSLSGCLNILLASVLVPVGMEVIDHRNSHMVENLPPKIAAGLCAGLVLCVFISLCMGQLFRIPENIAYAVGKAAGKIMKAAVDGAKDGRGQKE